MGQSVWNTSSIKSGKENVDNLTGSLAFHLSKGGQGGRSKIHFSLFLKNHFSLPLKFILQLSIDLNYVNPSVLFQGFIIDMNMLKSSGALFRTGSSD